MPKSERQKLKIFYIADYLMRKTDADRKGNMLHGVLIKDIEEYLNKKGIEAEKHSIRRDIDLLRGGKDAEYEPLLDIQGGQGKPIFLGSRFLPIDDLETIAECIASATFISKNQAEDLIDKLKDFCSEHQAKTLKSEYLVVERRHHTQEKMLKDLRTIREAKRDNQKITFIYTRRWNPDNIRARENRRKGDSYVVSPFEVVLQNGNHYLIGYDEKYHRVLPYRIDRMEKVKKKDEPREGKEEFDKLRIRDYAQQTFGMFIGGNAEFITLLCHNDLLDTMVERFGPERRFYTKVDDKHFTVKTFIVESENFYGWVCGLGKKVVIIDPPEVAERFKDYLQKIESNYQ